MQRDNCMVATKKERDLMNERKISAAEFFKALGHPMRLGIVEFLTHGEHTVTQIMTSRGISQGLTSQHLAVLRNAGIVDKRSSGSLRTYFLKDPAKTKAILHLASKRGS